MSTNRAMHPDEAIAIVGIGGLFPGRSPSINSGPTSGTVLMPPAKSHRAGGRSSPTARMTRRSPSRIMCTRSAEDLSICRHSMRRGSISTARLLERLDPVFRLALLVAQRAWNDARTDRVDRDRVGLVFGNIVLPTETASVITREVIGRAFAEKLGVPAEPAVAIEPLNAFPAGLPAALVARALGLRGPAYTIDAACGSSLYSLKLAIDELRAGRADAMLCGGVSRPDPLYTQMGFSQLRALSVRGIATPLDQDADGLVVAEGAGMFVLKRLVDAQAHGDRIYGLVAGIGLSNDIHGDLLAPSAEGQVRAMRMAYEQAGWRPDDVDLIECHAAGTPVGDAVETESLRTLWQGFAGRSADARSARSSPTSAMRSRRQVPPDCSKSSWP